MEDFNVGIYPESFKLNTEKSKLKFKSKNNSSISYKSKKDEDKDFHNYKSHSNKNSIVKSKLEKHELSLFKDPKSHNIHISNNYNKKLNKIFSLFLQKKKFKIQNEFDEKNAKKFLEKKNKCLERLILCDEIEKIENIDNEIKDESPQSKLKKKLNKSRRKSGTHSKVKNYCIIVSDYDDESKNEIKFHYTVKHQPRKLENLKKKNNLSKYFLNNEAKSPSKLSDVM